MRTGELRKHGVRIKLQDQPFKVLAMLLERPGELVTREEIRQRLWPADTFVDFDHSVNAAVRRLREALNDEADTPRFIETVPRHGYRFIADATPAIAAVAQPRVPPPTPTPLPVTSGSRAWRMWRLLLLIVVVVFGVLGAGVWPRAAIDSVAVLPFTNEAKDSNLDYLETEIPTHVIESLSRIPGLRVASRNSTSTFRGATVRTREASSALGVRALVVGAIRKKGELVVLSAELVDGRDDKHLWGAEYTLTGAQLATIDTTLALAVAQRLHQQVPSQVEVEMRQHATNPAAYEAYLRGEYVMDNRTNANLTMAVQYLQKAIDADPNFAAAYASMGKAYGLLSWYGGMPTDEADRMCEAAADRAIELDNTNSLAWMVKAAVLQNYHHDWEAAERAGRRALELGPNSAEINHYYSTGMWRRGRMEEAIAAADRAEALDSVVSGYTIGRLSAYYFARRLEDALRLRAQRPALRETWIFRLNMARIYAVTGHPNEALQEVSSLATEPASSPEDLCNIAQVYAMSGAAADARKILAAAQQKQGEEGQATTRACSHYDAAAVYAALGDRTRMLESLAAAERVPDPKLLDIFVDPPFDAFRSDPAFLALAKRLKTPR
ncbi:MAG TPA: winged helix-turn-helix domain-containing protein [Terriglobia bacterium]|nr:winged helix-turn-helix domain-containing protein [Terriglobia bacterium]